MGCSVLASRLFKRANLKFKGASRRASAPRYGAGHVLMCLGMWVIGHDRADGRRPAVHRKR